MVEIQAEILEKLKCSECVRYLSSSPVMIKTDGTNICHHCFILNPNNDSPAIQDMMYENLAAMMKFPCRHKASGCLQLLPWDETLAHEDGCEFRVYECPVTSLGNCTWTGFKSALMDHFKDSHPDQVVDHPCKLQLDVSRDSDQCLFMTVFGFLFLIQLKCNRSAGKLWSCVRFFGNANFASLFMFSFEVGNEEEGNRKRRVVQSDRRLLLSKSDVIEFSINDLLSSMSEYKNSRGVVEVMLRDKKCVYCKCLLTSELIYLSPDGCYCENCDTLEQETNAQAQLVGCKNRERGCTHRDIAINIPKHELWFCTYYEGKCLLNFCGQNIKDITRIDHVKPHFSQYCARSTVKSLNNCTYNNEHYYSMLAYNILFFFFFKFDCSGLKFRVFSELSKSDTKHFSCVMKVINPDTKHFVKKELQRDLSSPEHDWIIQIKNDVKNSLLHAKYENEVLKKLYNIKVTINKAT